MAQKNNHPFHYSEDKNSLQKLIDYLAPVGLFLLFFIFYNNYQITPSEMVKTTGLLSISLLGITLVIGPLSKIFPSLEFLKAHRKAWGILSFIVGFVHVLLVVHFFYKWNLGRFVDFNNPRYPGILSGLLALVILLLVTLTSNKSSIKNLSPGTWKIIQTTSYLAMFLAVTHFFLMESKDGVLVIKRLLGQITFWFSAFVIVIRIAVLFLPSKKS